MRENWDSVHLAEVEARAGEHHAAGMARRICGHVGVLPIALVAVGILALIGPAPRALAASGGTPDLGTKKDSGGPAVDLAGDITRKKVEKEEEEKPTLGYDAFRFSVELQLKDKRGELMKTLEQMAALNDDPVEKPDLLFRLAELSWEESRYWFFEANRQDDRIGICRETDDKACIAAAERDRSTYRTASQRFQRQAIQRYKGLIQEFPDYSRVDEVLFYLGHNLWEAGEEEEALGAYKTLITRFPTSRYVPDAWLAFGEWYFNNSDGDRELVEKALEAYIKAASFKDARIFGFAVYKQGWCLYNLGDFAGAADKFKATVFYGQLDGGGDRANKTALVREARKDFVLAFSRYEDPTQAKPSFEQVGGPDHWWSMLKGLAGLYYDDGKDKEAVLIYRQLIREQPLSPEAPLFQARIVDAVMRVGNKRITVEQARLLVRIFQDVKASGSVQTDEDQAMLVEAEKLSERTLRNLAVNWHNEGKRSRDEETYAFTSAVYGDYLAIFPEAEQAYTLRYYHAELLYHQLEQFDYAAHAYSQVVRIDAQRIEDGQDPGPLLVDAAEGAIFAHEELLKELGDEELPDDSDPHVPLSIPSQKQAFLDACDDYLLYVPKGGKRVEVAYRSAQIQYRYNHFEGAVERFSEIALEHPQHELAEYSANLVLDVFNLLEDYEKIDEWAKRFHGISQLAKGSFRQDLERIIERNSFKLVELLEKEGRFGDAGDRYIAFVTEWPRSELAGEALFNASVDYYKAGRIDHAIETRDRLVRSYPHSKMAPLAIYMNASVFEEIGEYDRAATGYEAYAAGYQKQAAASSRGRAQGREEGPVFEEEKARAALFNAGIFREALGDSRAAQENRERYLQLWPKSPDAEAVFLSIVDLHEANSAWIPALRLLEAYERENIRSANKSIMARYRIAKIQEKRGQRWPAADSYEHIWEVYRRLSTSTRAALSMEPGGAMEGVAVAHFRQSEPYWREFTKIKLRLPERVMAAQLQAKAAALLEVQKRYTETVSFGVPGPALCGLTRIGLAYQEFAQALYDAPIPGGLNEEQVDLYRDALTEQAYPVEIKAQEALAAAVEKSVELQFENECSTEAREILEQRVPNLFPPLLGEVVPVTIPQQRVGSGILKALQPPPPPPPVDAQIPSVVDERVPQAARMERLGPAPTPRPASRGSVPLPGRGAKGDPVYDEDLL